MNKLFSRFTNRYPISKTLRFRLIPVGETAKYIAEFKDQAIKELVERDKERAEKYKLTKEIIDEWHREHISMSLSSITSKEVKMITSNIKKYIHRLDEKSRLYNKKKNESSVNAEIENLQEEIENLQKGMRGVIAGKFGIPPRPKDLLEKHLPKWVEKNYARLIQIEELEELKDMKKDDFIELLGYWKGFSTYFGGFHENRKNIYSKDEKATAIGFRLVHENLPKHLDNIDTFKRAQKYGDLLLDKTVKEASKGKLTSAEKLFSPDSFVSTLTQEGIDLYNQALGGYTREDKAKIQGLNETINLYRQEKNLSKKDLPSFAELYKQILSRSDKASWLPPQFLDDREMLEAIQKFHEHLNRKDDSGDSLLEKMKKTPSQIEEDPEGIYIKADTLNKLSQQLEFHWGFIEEALLEEFEKQEDPKKKKGKTQGKESKLPKKDVYLLTSVEEAVEAYIDVHEDEDYRKKWDSSGASLFSTKAIDPLVKKIEEKYDELREEGIFSLEEISKKRDIPKDQEEEKNPKKGYHQISLIKAYLDSAQNLLHRLKHLYLVKSRKPIEVSKKNLGFYSQFDPLYEELETIIPLYNKTRSHLTKKPYSRDKIKLTFGNGTLGDGWDVNKEVDNHCILLKKNDQYYLGIFNKEIKKKKGELGYFQYVPNIDDQKSEKKLQAMKELKNKITANEDEVFYEKALIKSIPDPRKMLPKVFFSGKRINDFNPSKKILDIRNHSSHAKGGSPQKGFEKKDFNLDDCHSMIDFFKESINKHPEWNLIPFSFRSTKEYTDTSEFSNEIEEQAYSVQFEKIKESYINGLVEEKKMFLFQIYNKDFSKHSTGKPNLHTIYWKLLFDKENLKDTVIKLSGGAELFFRDKKINKRDITRHAKNKPIKNKNPENHKKKESIFTYELVKDKRFTEDQFFLYTPIILNFKARGNNSINRDVLEALQEQEDIHIIGIDRGERHLLYYSVINRKGEVIEQGTFNIIHSIDKDKVSQSVDYQALLAKKEGERDTARKSWAVVENIKEIKAGYLSHVIHKLTDLMLRYDAIVALENLNFGFKKGRFKVERQVYQKFERALIHKLNYLVFKEASLGELGHPLKALQLTSGFESFEKLGKQSGFLFYVPAAYTSKVDPWTGFTGWAYHKYKNKEDSKVYFEKFDSIHYDKKHDHFIFRFSLQSGLSQVLPNEDREWEVCTHGDERHYWSKDKGSSGGAYKAVHVTEKLKELFKDTDYQDGQDLKDYVLSWGEKEFFSTLHWLFNLTVRMRYTYKGTKNGEELDYILSPIRSKSGEFFDSRKYRDEDKWPSNADANGAYHIALKAQMMMQQLREEDLDKSKNIKWKTDKVSWFDYLIRRSKSGAV